MTQSALTTPTANLFSKVYRLTATKCCVCRLSLRDSKSVELGIGPICRSNYGDPQVPTSETMLKKALGLLAVADLPQDVVKDILKHKTDARTVCNMLVYYASYHYDNKTEVLKVTGIIRELGYENLATKLETDRTNISITVEESGDFVVRTPHDWGYLREARKVAGSQRLRGKLGGKVVRFPAATQKEMMTRVSSQ